MDIIKVIDRDIASVKERIDSENKDGQYDYEFDGEKFETADEVLEAVGEWEALDCNLSYDAGYVAGLSCAKIYIDTQSSSKLKSVLAKLKSALRRIDQNDK